MSCSNCTEAKLIPTCTGLLHIGTFTPSTDYWVYVKNLITGIVYRQTRTTNEAGLLTFDLTSPDTSAYSPNFDYELWVTSTDINMSDYIPININGIDYDCLNIGFFGIKGSSVGYDNSYDSNYSNLSTDYFVLGI